MPRVNFAERMRQMERQHGPDACWTWPGKLRRDGYARTFYEGRWDSVHRLAYLIRRGHLPSSDLDIDHLCRNRACFNPAHLEVVTPRTNVLRGVSIQAQNARKTHCVHGHEFTVENTERRPNGHRACRACAKARHPGLHGRNKTHCKRGHEFTPENTRYFTQRGGIGRACRACEKRRRRLEQGIAEDFIHPKDRPTCKHGHPKTPENTYLHNRGTFVEHVCRECTRIAQRSYQQRKRERQRLA